MFGVFVRLVVVQSCVLHVHFSTESICKVEVLIVVIHCSTGCWVIKQEITCCGFYLSTMSYFALDCHVLLAVMKCFPLQWHQLHSTCANMVVCKLQRFV